MSILLAMLVLVGACSGRQEGAQIGMSRQSVLESPSVGLPKRQELTADGKTDFYDWGSVRYDDRELVVEVTRDSLPDAALTSAGETPVRGRLERVRRIAVAAPTIEIYEFKFFGSNELLPAEGVAVREQLSALMVQELKSRFPSVIDLNTGSVAPATASQLRHALAEFNTAVGRDPLNQLTLGRSADEVGASLARVAHELEVDAVLISTMTATVHEATVNAIDDAALSVDGAAGGTRCPPAQEQCGHYQPPPPIFIPFPIIQPSSPKRPPVAASLSMALVAADTGEILWSQIGRLEGYMTTIAELTSSRLERLVYTTLPELPIS